MSDDPATTQLITDLKTAFNQFAAEIQTAGEAAFERVQQLVRDAIQQKLDDTA